MNVFASHLMVVPGWVVLCEAAGEVLRVWFPEEIELALVDSVFDAPAARVERLECFWCILELRTPWAVLLLVAQEESRC